MRSIKLLPIEVLDIKKILIKFFSKIEDTNVESYFLDDIFLSVCIVYNGSVVKTKI